MRSLHSYLAEPWAILPDAINSIIDEARADIMPGAIVRTPPAIQASFYSLDGEPFGAQKPKASSDGVVAIVPLSGSLTRHGYSGMFSSAAGMADVERLVKRLDNDRSIAGIVLAVDSPGGTVAGTPELASTLYEIRRRGRTATATIADTLMASAAVYVGTATDYVASIGSGTVGSIGVISMYSDYSRALDKAGIDVSVTRAPNSKARFTGVEPMTDSMRQFTEQRIKKMYNEFVEDVSKHRGVSIQHVQKRFGAGEVMDAQDAADVGLIDAVDTIEGVISKLRSTNKRKAV